MNRKTEKQRSGGLGGRRLIYLMILLTLTMFLACAGPESGESDDDGNQNAFKITDVKYHILNNIGDYQSIPYADSDVRSCYYFQVNYEGEAPDIESLKVNLRFSGVYEWNFEDFDDAGVDTENKIITIDLVHPWDDNHSYDWSENVLPIGDLIVEVEFSEGQISHQYTKTLVGPGEDDTTNHDFIYTEDFDQVSPDNSIPMIPRALITQSAVKDANGMTIYFSVDDDNVQNGLIWFLDANSELVAYTKLFFDSEGNWNLILNNGAPLETNDSENVVDLNIFNLVFPDDTTISLDDITQYIIILSDEIDSSDNVPFVFENGCVSFTDRALFNSDQNN